MQPLRTLVTISLALLSAAAAVALPTTAPCHKTHSAHAMGETYEQAAGLARALVKNTSVGTFMTVMNADRQDGKIEGFPFGSVDYYADNCDDSGTPLMLLSHLQINVQNARTQNRVSLAIRRLPKEGERGNVMVDPRVTLMGHLAPLDTSKHASAVKCFGERHPDARWWMPGDHGFHDFKWYTLEVEEIYYVGGFGGAHYIGFIDVDTYRRASPDAALAGLDVEKMIMEKEEENTIRFQAQKQTLF
ncbi:hypothetical protein BG011_009002 [Mortierella polycephala]|uniref:CREG-like beta-barrel domain-containing protein n=1 Tax=Mortierella polycephala TaxID=41804 RepID=A0A9P6TWM3_9FUNG|nr:hypothetical protein BG011_009002 [Mortierella polycephala]